MPITSFTIDGDEVDPLLESLEIRETIGEVSTLICDVESLGSPVTRFLPRSVVVVEEDGVKIFAGRITQLRERGFGGAPNLYDADTDAEQIVTSITAEDFARILEHIYVTETVVAGTTLKAFLTTLITNHFGARGVTLHGSQADGPALPDMVFDVTSGADVIRALEDATGYLSRVDYDKALRMWAAGDIAAPFNISEYDSPARWTDDVEVENILGDGFANHVIVRGSLLTEQYRVETWTGDGITDTFPLTWTPTQFYGYVTRNAALVPEENETLTFEDAVGTATWTYYAGTNSIKRETGPPEVGADIRLRFDGTFQAYAEAGPPIGTDPEDVVDVLVTRDDLRDNVAAQALADSLLEEHLNAGEQRVSYSTRFVAPTMRVGQQQTIAATPRQVSGDYLISDLSIRAETPVTADYAASDLGFIRRVTAKQNHALSGKYQQTYRDWLKDREGGSAAQVSGTATVGPDLPDESIQYNDGGRFGGEPEWLYQKAESSVKLGTNHTVNADAAANLLVGDSHTVN